MSLTKEQIDQESILATQANLVQLGRVLQEEEQKKSVFEKNYNELNDEFNNLIDFSIDYINQEFNIKQFLSTIKSKNDLVFFTRDTDLYNNLYKLYILNEMTKHKLELQENINCEKSDEIREINEQVEDYMEQLETLETDTDSKLQELTLRIIKLRTKCIVKNKIIFWQKIVCFVLIYIIVVSPNTTFDQATLILYKLFFIISFLVSCILYVFSSLYTFLSFLNILPIIIGIGIGGIGILYLNKNKIVLYK